MNDNDLGVLVAVGPDGVRDGTLDVAAAEADRLGTGVELVHVVHSLVVVPAAEDQVQEIDRSLTETGHRVLTDAAARLRERLAGRQAVATQLLTGPVAATICSRGGDAAVVLLERRDAGAVERLLTMSISTRVAARCRGAVVVVPQSWRAGAAADLPVTVGVDHAVEAIGQTEAAAAYACSAGRPLVVLHGVWLPEPYQDMVFMDYRRDEWVRDATAQLAASLASLPTVHDLDLRTDVRWVRPVDALVEASAASSLLVLSRRTGRHVAGGQLGGITRTVLQHTRCPVMIVDRTVSSDGE
jgi:nucleotide-binding universal stress UspA family protein